MKTTRLHVDQHAIRHNIHATPEDLKPVFTAKDYKQNRKGFEAEILDAEGNVIARLVYADGVNRKPLSCGARVWIETQLEVKVVGTEIIEAPDMEECAV